MLKGVALDLGGVLLTDATRTIFPHFEREFGIDAEAGAALWHSSLRIPAELGLISETEVWSAFQELTDAPTSVEELRATFLAEFHPIPYGIAALTRLTERNIKVGLATNHVAAWLDVWTERYSWFSLLEPICCSSTLGCRKPDGAFFRKVLDQFAVSSLRFVDDDGTNVNAARVYGLEAILAEDDWMAYIENAHE